MHPPTATLAVILKGYPRISESFISNEILLLESLGFRIHIFSMRHPREPFAHASVQKIRATVDYLPSTLLAPLPRLLYHNARVARRRPHSYRQALFLAVQRLARTHKSATIKHLLQAGYLVDRLANHSSITHLHAHFAHSPTSVAMFASLISGLPFSFSAHAKDIYTSNPRQLKDKIARARFAVTCTQANLRYLKALAGKAPTPIYRVYHGIDIRLFSAPHQRPGPANPYRLITVARLTPKKGLPTVYRALSILKKQGIAFEHRLIGDGDQRSEIMDLIASLDLQSQCRWLGTLAHEDVLAHYRQSDLFVIGCEVTRNGDRDGIPNVLIESMAMGVPVVATQAASISELIPNEDVGLLVPPKDPVRLADAILRALTDRTWRQQVMEKGQQRVHHHFDNQRLIGNLADIFHRHAPYLNHLAQVGP